MTKLSDLFLRSAIRHGHHGDEFPAGGGGFLPDYANASTSPVPAGWDNISNEDVGSDTFPGPADKWALATVEAKLSGTSGGIATVRIGVDPNGVDYTPDYVNLTSEGEIVVLKGLVPPGAGYYVTVTAGAGVTIQILGIEEIPSL